MNKLVKRLLTGTLAFATILTALPVTAVHASGNQYWTESAERVGYIEQIMNDGSIKSTFHEGHMKVEGETAYCVDINTNFKNGYKTSYTSIWNVEKVLYAIPFCELPDIIIDKVAIWDTYKTDYTTFNICGHDIYVYDDELAKVIKQLSDRYRENVLMYYFLDMSDTEIAKLQNISRSGVFQNRHYALKQMKKSLEEEH